MAGILLKGSHILRVIWWVLWCGCMHAQTMANSKEGAIRQKNMLQSADGPKSSHTEDTVPQSWFMRLWYGKRVKDRDKYKCKQTSFNWQKQRKRFTTDKTQPCWTFEPNPSNLTRTASDSVFKKWGHSFLIYRRKLLLSWNWTDFNFSFQRWVSQRKIPNILWFLLLFTAEAAATTTRSDTYQRQKDVGFSFTRVDLENTRNMLECFRVCDEDSSCLRVGIQGESAKLKCFKMNNGTATGHLLRNSAITDELLFVKGIWKI